MNHSMINSAVSLHALQQKLDIIASNIANVDTTGYKRKTASFEDILNKVQQQPKGFQKEGRLSPLGFNQGWGAKLSMSQFDLSQGTLESTGNMSDLAIEGGAMFQVSARHFDENGNPVQQIAYTRDGSFELSVNPNDPDNKVLATKEGYYVLGADGQPIRVPRDSKMVVEEDGTVKAYPASGNSGDAVEVGRLQLARVLRPQYLEQLGDNLYSTLPDVKPNDPAVMQPIDQGAALSGTVKVRQGFLEKSNVNLTDEMTELTTVQRAFQLNSRALTSADTMMNLANNLRG